LALHGNATDLDRARRYLRDPSSDSTKPAIEIIARFGDESDVDALLDIVRKSYGERKMVAAVAALKLGPGRVASDFLQTDDPDLVGAALRSLLDEEPSQMIPKLEPLLDSESGQIRKKAVAYLLKRFPQAELESILDYYVEKPTYYYHVVASIDKAVYAPTSLRAELLRDILVEL